MTIQLRKKASSWIVMIAMLMVGICGIVPEQVRAERMIGPLLQGEDCEPNGGRMWTSGPADPEVILQAQEELRRKGIDAVVEARNYGETDNCGTYEPRGIDFIVNLTDAASNNDFTKEILIDTILPVLTELGKPELGNVELFSATGESIPVNPYNEFPALRSLNMAPLTDVVTLKVYVIVYDPLLSNGQRLSQYMHWNDHATLTQQTINFFNQASHGEVNYTVADTTVVTSGWPELMDGFKYTEQTYLAAWSNPSLYHSPTEVNYSKIINSPEFDICGKLNRGEIDEVWIYNGPWFGFYESTLAGPNAYPMNSPPVSGKNNCNRIVPIMGPSLERRVEYFVEDFSHRAEATMTKVYGSWQQNNTTHTWDKFTLVKTQSPDYSYSGCGVAHYPPNAALDAYIYDNRSSVLSNCADFVNYPNLGDPLQVSQSITCSAWGCTTLGFFLYWFGHFPYSPGCGPENVANDWWKYMIDPELALHPYSVCQSDEHLISGNAGTVAVTLNYTDGVAKTAFTDNYGNYSLLVSNHWSGTITPAKPGYMFNPASLSYTAVQTDLPGQDYGAQTTAAPSLYVNAATGNNSNSCKSINAPCRNIQEAITKSGVGSIIYVTSDTYLFSTNPSPNVVIINRSVTLSGGWNSDFTSQTGISVIDGGNVNNGILTTWGTVIVENFTIQNTRAFNSGAIYIENGSFILSRSTLKNNTATSNGGGIFLDRGFLKIINSTIDQNVASGAGGGIYAALNSAASIYIQNSTITNNRASRGGGISSPNGTYNIKNTIIANNSSSISGPDCDGTLASANFNIIENLAGCSITSGSNNLNIDPRALSGVDLGDNASCPVVDQRGITRPQGAKCDIGAYEHVDTTVPIVNSFTTASLTHTLNIPVTTFIASDDVAVTGYKITTNSTPPVASADGWSSTAPVSYTVPSEGFYTLYPWAKDMSGNVSSVFATPSSVVVDILPTVLSIVRADEDPASANSVEFTVTFSESVTGVEMNDFTLDSATGGISGATIHSVLADGTCAGSTYCALYSVTVNTGDGNGTLRLDVPVNASITNATGDSLADLPFEEGEFYTVEKAPVYGVVKYDDADEGWTYSGFTATTTTGPYLGTMHYSKAVGNTAEFTFEGSQITLWYSKYSNRGILAVYLDDDPTPIATINEYNATRVWQASWTSGNLGAGEHTVRLVHASGAQVDIDALEVKEYEVPGLGKHDDAHAGWTYTGFVATTTTGPYLGTMHYSKAIGNTAEFTFEGSQIVLTYSKYSNRGALAVYLDDDPDPIAVINEYNATRVWQATWTSGNLGAGEHTVRLVHASGAQVDIDALEVKEYVNPGPGKYDDVHAGWTYNGFVATTTTGPYKGTMHYSKVVGSEAEFTFEGSQIVLTYSKYSNRGTLEVYIDDNPDPIATIDQYNGTRIWQASWTSEDLGAGEHTVRLVHAGGAQVDIDALTVQEP